MEWENQEVVNKYLIVSSQYFNNLKQTEKKYQILLVSVFGNDQEHFLQQIVSDLQEKIEIAHYFVRKVSLDPCIKTKKSLTSLSEAGICFSAGDEILSTFLTNILPLSLIFLLHQLNFTAGTHQHLFDLQSLFTTDSTIRSFHPRLLFTILVLLFQSYPVPFISVLMVLLHVSLGLPGFITSKVQREMSSISHESKMSLFHGYSCYTIYIYLAQGQNISSVSS